MSRLWATGLCKKYKQRQVVQDVNISIESGQIVGLLGPNGAGKTTSFYMLAGLIPTDSGSIGLDDIDLTGTAMHQRALEGVGYLPQEASVFRGLSVEDNILAILELRKGLSKEERHNYCESKNRKWTYGIESCLSNYSGNQTKNSDRCKFHNPFGHFHHNSKDALPKSKQWC